MSEELLNYSAEADYAAAAEVMLIVTTIVIIVGLIVKIINKLRR